MSLDLLLMVHKLDLSVCQTALPFKKSFPDVDVCLVIRWCIYLLYCLYN